MSENLGQRLTVTVAALVIALCIVFSPLLDKLFHPSNPLTGILNLRPGIDMVGGTSLVYEIKPPPGGYRGQNTLAVDVMTALQRRVDPNGVKNLVWRPQGNNRLEIQMPMTPEARANSAKRDTLQKDLSAAESELDATNIRPDEVLDAVRQTGGKTRADLARLAQGSPQRQELFAKIVKAFDGIEQARKEHNADEQARLTNEFERLTQAQEVAGRPKRSALQEANIGVQELENMLSAPDRAQQLAALKQRFTGWSSRLKAIDDYERAYAGLGENKGSIDDANELKRLLQGAGVLEFHILVDATENPTEYRKMISRLQADGPRVEAGDTMRWFEVEKPKDFHYAVQTYNNKSYVLAWLTPDKSLDNRPGTPHWVLTRASPTLGQFNEQVVGFAFDPQGGQLFGQLTGANINKPMAIMLDGKVISAPNIKSKITDSGTIDGGADGFGRQELDYLVNTLAAGSLPAQLNDQPISERTVGPQLGADNLRAGLIACGLGLVVVAVFLISYYYIAGVVAYFAVLLNVLLILAVMAALNATFTLPSIAGIVLTIGTAVDANVLIFERLREEQHRGLSLKMALRNAYGKALSAIIDSNMTTVITSLFLIWFGTEEVKGFGITLIIGILASLFTALFVTRTIFNVLIEKFGLRQLNSLPLTYPKWDKLLRPNIDWMRLAPGFIAFSAIAITIGIVLFAIKAHQGQVMDIEFASGTSVQFELKQPMEIHEVRKLVEKADSNMLPSPSVISIGSDQKTYEIITPHPDSRQVKEAVLKSMVGSDGKSLLNAEVPSTFAGSSQPIKPLAEVLNKQAVPITAENSAKGAAWPGAFRPPDLRDFSPGVAIYLDKLDPPLTPGQIKDRITQQQLQSSSPVRQEFVVDSADGDASRPTSSAVVLATDPNLSYAKDPGTWEQLLADPLWKLVNEGVARPAQLQQVKNFDAAVAGDAQRDALMALFFSIVVIMAYIWVRFGNLKYGTATVIALLHDTLFTIAALGFSHYLVYVPGLRQLLELEPFRINLTVVAGILTIMGYSMIDTIVVFDRIREIRGKFGHVSRQVINDAINQTLSRTLLTAGTTTITVAIMYFVGGPGIHGFTFVLLVGILVGTYSSIAIAAPFLLIGGGDSNMQNPTVRTTAKLQRAGV